MSLCMSNESTIRRWYQFSLRNLMLVVALVALVLGSVFGYVRYERERIGHKWAAASELRELGIQLGSGPWPRSFEQMWTWRGCETIDYVEYCTIGPSAKLNAGDLSKLVSTFPNIRDVMVIDYELTGEQLRLLAMLPRLEKLAFCRSPANEED